MYYLATVLPMIVCLVWTVIFALDYRKNDPAKRMLTVFGLVSTLLYACHFVHFNQLSASPLWDSLYFFCNLSVYPLYNIYVHKLTRTQKAPNWYFLLWFIPAAVVCIWSLTGTRGGNGAMMTVQFLFPMVSIAASIDAAIRLLRFRKSVDNYYSNPEHKRLDPVLVLIILQFVTTVFSFIANLLGRDTFLNKDLLMAPALFFSALLFGIFYIGNSTEFPEEEIRNDVPAPPAETPHGFGEEQQKQLMERIERQMHENQLFRTKGLTISNLAEAVGSNRTYVSVCINQLAGYSFSDYVNQARIQYILKLMENGDTRTLSEMADEAGFAERTSFYRSFKKVVGTSPSTYLARL